MITCPNKNTQEWKDLVEFAGNEVRAFSLYRRFNEFKLGDRIDIPTIEQATRLDYVSGTKLHTIKPTSRGKRYYSKETPKPPKIKEGVSELFESNPELASIGTKQQYSQYLDTVFPSSKVKDIVYHGTPYRFDTFKGISFFSNSFDEAEELGIQRFFHNELTPVEKQQLGMVQYRPGESYGAFRGALFNYYVEKNKRGYKERDYDDAYDYIKQSGILDRFLGRVNIISALINAENLTESNDPLHKETLSKQTKLNEVIKGKDLMPPLGYKRNDIVYAVFNPEQIHILGSKQDIKGFKSFIGNAQNIQFQKETPASVEKSPIQGENQETLSDLDKKLNILKSSFKVDVVLDPDLGEGVSGALDITSGKPVIRLNPNFLKKDTAIHEFGHLYIDLLGGIDNPFISRGVKMLKGSKAEKHVEENYPELEDDKVTKDKEILATAIGWEGSKIFDAQQKGLISKWASWTKIFFNKLRLKTGLGGNVAMELASRMLNREVLESDLNYSNLSASIQFQKEMEDAETVEKTKEEKWTSKLFEDIESRIIVLQKKYERSKDKNEKKAVTEFRKEINSLMASLKESNDTKSLMRYVEIADAKADSVLKRLSAIEKREEPPTAEELKPIREFISAFNLTKDVIELADNIVTSTRRKKNKTTRDFATIEYLKKYIVKMQNTQSKIDNIISKIDYLGIEATAHKLLPHSTFIRNKYRELFLKEFIDDKKKKGEIPKSGIFRKNDSKFEEEKNEYINSKISEISERIEEEEYDYIVGQLRVASRDVSNLTSKVLDPRSFTDAIIQTTLGLIERAEYKVMREFTDELAKAENISKRFGEVRKGYRNNQAKYYEPILEKINGKLTGHLIGKYKSSYFTALSEYFKGQEELEEEDTIPQRSKFIEKLKEEHLNPQYVQMMQLPADSPIREMYEYQIKLSERKDAVLPKASKLGKTVMENRTIAMTTYKLPSIEKGNLERMLEGRSLETLKEQAKSLVQKKESDTEHGELATDEEGRIIQSKKNSSIIEIATDEEGREKRNIPIYFRYKMENENDRSYDIMSVQLMDLYSAINYKEKKLIEADIYIVQNLVGTRSVHQVTKGGALKVNKDTGKAIPSKQDEKYMANTTKAFASIIEQRLFGISSVDFGSVGGVHINKIAQGIMGYAGSLMLSLNYFSAGANALQGKSMNFIEGFAGEWFTQKNLRVGEKLWWKDAKNSMKDIGKVRSNSTTGLLVERFNTMGAFSGLGKKFSNHNRLKMMFTGDTLNFMNNLAEHNIQGTMMYTILDTIEVTNSLTGEKAKLHEVYENTGNELTIKKGFEHVVTEQFEYQVGRKIKEIIKQTHGNYDSFNQSMAQRFIGGKMTFMMRKWLVPGTVKRWRGIENIGREELEDHQRYYSEILGQDLEGSYVTTLRFMTQLSKDLKHLKRNAVTNWATLDNHQKANIRRTIAEVGLTVLSMIASSILYAAAKDDDDESLYYLAFLAKRLETELSFYALPGSTIEIVNSPAVTVSLIEDIGGVLELTFSDAYNLARGEDINRFERDTKTADRGDSKLAHKLFKDLMWGGSLSKKSSDIAKWYMDNM